MARCTCVKCGWSGEPGELIFDLHDAFKDKMRPGTFIEQINNKVLKNLPHGPLKFPAKAFVGNSYPMQIDKRTFRYATFDALCWLGGYVELLRGDMTYFSKEKIHENLEQINKALLSSSLVWVNAKLDGSCKANTIIRALDYIKAALEGQEKSYNERKAEIDIKYFYHDGDSFSGSMHEITEYLRKVKSALDSAVKTAESGSNSADGKNQSSGIGDGVRLRNVIKKQIEGLIKDIEKSQKNLRNLSIEILMETFQRVDKKTIDFIESSKNLPTSITKALTNVVLDNETKQALRELLTSNEDNSSQEVLYSFRELEPRKGQGDIAVGSLMIGAKPISKRYCPECCAEMSRFAGSCKEYVLTVIGNPRVSKSTGLAAAISYIKQQPYGVSVETDGENEGWQRFKTDYLDKYEQNRKVMATTTGQNDNGIPQFSIKFNFDTGKSCIITILDIPGELIRNASEDTWKLYGKLYKQVDYVWFCMDVPEIERIVPHVNVANDKMLEKSGYMDHGQLQCPVSVEEIVENMSKAISPIGMITGDRHGDVKAMFVITKSDVANENDRNSYSLLGQDDVEEIQYDHARRMLYVDESFMYQKMINWRRYISDKQGEKAGAVWRMFERSFPKHGYCALSAYGIDGPKAEERPHDDGGSQNDLYQGGQIQQGGNGWVQGNNPMYAGFGPLSTQSYSGFSQENNQKTGFAYDNQQYNQYGQIDPYSQYGWQNGQASQYSQQSGQASQYGQQNGQAGQYSRYGQQNGQVGQYSQYGQQNDQASQYSQYGQQNGQVSQYSQYGQIGQYSQYGQQNGQVGQYSQYGQQNGQAGQYSQYGQQNGRAGQYSQYGQSNGQQNNQSSDPWSFGSNNYNANNAMLWYQNKMNSGANQNMDYSGGAHMAAQAVDNQIIQQTSNSPHGYMTGWPLVWMFIMEGYMGVEIQKLEVSSKIFSKKTEVKKDRVCVDKDPKVEMNMGMVGYGRDDMYYTR